MFIVNSYPLAVIFCFITMMCWSSWGNTQKLAAKSWRYELFYWDYVIGMLLFSLLISFTMGSFGSQGRPFIEDLAQADAAKIWSVILGGIIFNASNILLSASTSIAGMSVAFPLGVGLSLVLGVIINWLGSPKGDPVILFTGVALIAIAIICNGIASGKMQKGKDTADSGRNRKGIILAVIAGILMSFFYRFVAKAMDLDNFENPAPGMLTPYSAIFIFSVGVFLSNFIFNTLVMRHPFVGERVYYKEYFAGSVKTHLVGMLGGAIWCLGTAFSYIASGKAGAAISYALGQGAPLIAAIWGVFIWKEFKGAGKGMQVLGSSLFFCNIPLQRVHRCIVLPPGVHLIGQQLGEPLGGDDQIEIDLLFKTPRAGILHHPLGNRARRGALQMFQESLRFLCILAGEDFLCLFDQSPHCFPIIYMDTEFHTQGGEQAFFPDSPAGGFTDYLHPLSQFRADFLFGPAAIGDNVEEIPPVPRITCCAFIQIGAGKVAVGPVYADTLIAKERHSITDLQKSNPIVAVRGTDLRFGMALPIVFSGLQNLPAVLRNQTEFLRIGGV